MRDFAVYFCCFSCCQIEKKNTYKVKFLMTLNWLIYWFLNNTAPAQPQYSPAHPLTASAYPHHCTALAHPPVTSYWPCFWLWLFKTGVCTAEKTVTFTTFTAYSRCALTAYFRHQIIYNVNATKMELLHKYFWGLLTSLFKILERL